MNLKHNTKMRKIKDKGTGKYLGIAEQELKPIKNVS
jgi:hypothetical protein